MVQKTSKVVIAHRGLSGTYPENTLLSFKKALETKAPWLECDVHLSKDDQVMVIHDEYLTRTTTATGLIGEYTQKELKKFSAGFPKKFGNRFLEEKIPTLLEVLELMESSKRGLLIEIKSHEKDALFYHKKIGPTLYKTIKENFPKLLKEQIVFISFNLFILETIRAEDKKAHIAPLFHEHPKKGTLSDQALKLDTDMVIFSKKLLEKKEVIQQPKKVRHAVYTVFPNEFDAMEKIKDLYGYATDFADLIT